MASYALVLQIRLYQRFWSLDLENPIDAWDVLVLVEPAILEEAHDCFKQGLVRIFHSKFRWNTLAFHVVLIFAVQQPQFALSLLTSR